MADTVPCCGSVTLAPMMPLGITNHDPRVRTSVLISNKQAFDSLSLYFWCIPFPHRVPRSPARDVCACREGSFNNSFQ